MEWEGWGRMRVGDARGKDVLFQEGDGIRGLVRSRGHGDVYKGQAQINPSIFQSVDRCLRYLRVAGIVEA